MIATVKAPIQVGPIEHDSWWKNLLLTAKVGDIHLLLPGLDTAAFLPSLRGQSSYRLNIGAYRINRVRADKYEYRERWEMLSETVEARLLRVEGQQIVLCVEYPQSGERPLGTMKEELLLVVAIERTDADGKAQRKTAYIRLDPRGSGMFPAVNCVPPLPHAPLLPVEPLLLELAHV